jgi:predicted patatin/cPLA2 family phospholipase
MKNFFFKNINNLIDNKNNTFDNILKKIIKLKRKNKNFIIPQKMILRKIICLKSLNTRSVYKDFSLSRMHIKKDLSLKILNGLKKVSW